VTVSSKVKCVATFAVLAQASSLVDKEGLFLLAIQDRRQNTRVQLEIAIKGNNTRVTRL
jgi:hypothetical protein